MRRLLTSLDAALSLVEGSAPLDQPEITMADQPCLHLNARAASNIRVNHVKCPDCGQLIPIWDVFNNWLDEFRAIRQELTGKDT